MNGHLTADVAREYVTYAEDKGGDELDAALALSYDRQTREGRDFEPDPHDIHHCLYLIRRALGIGAPSYDNTILEMRKRDWFPWPTSSENSKSTTP